ncbi:PAS domain S-box protein [Flaviaesturariibacter amylovorans]|uniref:Oxygen sensor histidine kinase NreB n=1 Tax=Flaviaesturariibacter amylovorans TaxID=1084520 RepID=A0ABP8HKD4_9BACT
MYPISSIPAGDGAPSEGLQQAFILDQVDDIIVSTDPALVVQWLNKAALRFFPGGTAGRSLATLAGNTQPDGFFEALYGALLATGTGHGELSLAGESGALHLFSFTLRSLPGQSGCLLIGRDVTGERAAQQELRHRERFYHGLINDSLDGILVIDPAGRIHFASPSVHRVLGYPPAEILERNAFDFVHPDDHEKTREAFEREVAQTPEIKFVEVRVRNRTGGWTPCMVRGHNLMAHPDVQGIVVYLHDDRLRREAGAALRESEARFRMLIANLQQGVLLHDAEARLVLSNEAAKGLLGLPASNPGLACTDSFWNDVIDEQGRFVSTDRLPVPTVLRTGTPVWNALLGHRHPDTGHRTWMLVSSTPVRHDDGTLAYVITSLTDISERKRLEEQLLSGQIAHQRQLTQATIDSSEKERAAIGKELHDNIGQQLTTIKLYLDLARSTADEDTAEMVALATRNVSDVINEIRSLCRALVPSTLGDLGLVESVNDLIHAFTRTRHMQIRLDVDAFDEEDVPENQKLMLFRILQEQLNNIAKHAGAEAVTVTLENEAGPLRMTVTDNGKGFDPATVRRGLGLTNMQNRAETCGGTFLLDSAPGEGSVLIVEVPREKKGS